LAQVVRQCVPRTKGRRERIHPATRTFQALRIAVNDEMGSLKTILDRAADCLCPAGRNGRDQLSFAGRSPRETGLSRRSALRSIDQAPRASQRRGSGKQPAIAKCKASRRSAHRRPCFHMLNVFRVRNPAHVLLACGIALNMRG
jgi:hypothetical protein